MRTTVCTRPSLRRPGYEASIWDAYLQFEKKVYVYLSLSFYILALKCRKPAGILVESQFVLTKWVYSSELIE